MMPTKKSNDFPPLETPRLLLRGLMPDDVVFVFQHFSDPAVTQHLLDEPPLSRLQEAKDLIDMYRDTAGKTYNRWGVVLKVDNALVGTCGYHKWDKAHRRAEIGYDLTPAHWGQGIMSEALRAALRHGFEDMNLNRIDALVYPENTPSANLLRKLGFQQEGLLREYFCLEGRFYDHWLFSLLRSEWSPSRGEYPRANGKKRAPNVVERTPVLPRGNSEPNPTFASILGNRWYQRLTGRPVYGRFGASAGRDMRRKSAGCRDWSGALYRSFGQTPARL